VLDEIKVNVLQSLEAKLEVLRLKSEEASASTGTDAQAKLLRQIETLQSQYALASENWQGIESALNTRCTALEKERDDLAKREAEVRKKAREVNSKARHLEEELETSTEQTISLSAEIEKLKEKLAKMETRLADAEKTAKEAREELEAERRDGDVAVQRRIEEEKAKWRAELGSGPSTPLDVPSGFLRAEHGNTRKSSATSDLIGMGSGTLRRSSGRHPHHSELGLLLPGQTEQSSRPTSRRGGPGQYPVRTPTDPSLASRGLFDHMGSGAASPPVGSHASIHHHLAQISSANGGTPPMISTAPSIHTVDADGVGTPKNEDADSQRGSSPHRTVAEYLSNTSQHLAAASSAGPSVQLVERMSASVRRLEMEKAAAREELARMQSQRDGARDEVVSLMRELDGVKEADERIERMETEMGGLKERYEAALEMLGEKSEECEELRNDVLDLKKIYRELVENTMK
jgi:predicted  nucleic acid-binding Zn-ribbon protein